MNIAIIGAGSIGRNLGQALLAKGHGVRYGVRDPQSAKTLQALAATGAEAVTIAEAARWAEVIALAVPWDAARATVEAMGDVRGKILIDITNRFVQAPGAAPSAAEDIAGWATGARVVKAFNTMAAEALLDPLYSGQPATAFVCGDDAAARQTVIDLARQIGLQAVDSGPLSNAALTEALGRLWVSLMRSGMGRDFALTLIRR